MIAERISGAWKALTQPRTVAASRYYPQYLGENFAVPNIDDLIEERGYEILREMVERDDQIQSCLWMITFGVLSTGYQVTSMDRHDAKAQQAAEWTRFLLRNMASYSLPRLVMDSCEALWIGHVVIEKVQTEPYGPKHEWPGKQGIRVCKPVAQESLRIAVDDFGEIKEDGIWQLKHERQSMAITSLAPDYYEHHPRENFIVWSLMQKWGNPYGQSLLRAVWPWYFAKTQALLWWGQHLEHFGLPLPIGRVKAGTTQAAKDAFHLLLRKLTALRALVLEGEAKVEFQNVSATSTDSFQQFIQECNRGIGRALFNPSLLMDNSGGGSRALGNTQQDTFVTFISPVRNFIYEEVIERQLVRPSIAYNFGEDFPCPNVTPQENDPGRLKASLELYKGVVELGVPVGVDHIRQVMGVPEPGDDEELAEVAQAPVAHLPNDPNMPPDMNADPGEMEQESMKENEDAKTKQFAAYTMDALERRARVELTRARNGDSHAIR